jgi:hypothetical protein
VRAVVADGRRGDEHAGAGVGGTQAGDQVARAELARLAQAPLGVVAPALRDVLAGEVDHPVAPGERLGRRRLVLRPPCDRLDAEGIPRALRVARQHRHLVAAPAQRADEPRPDPPRGSCDRHPHALGTVAVQPWIARNSVVSPCA